MASSREELFKRPYRNKRRDYGKIVKECVSSLNEFKEPGKQESTNFSLNINCRPPAR